MEGKRIKIIKLWSIFLSKGIVDWALVPFLITELGYIISIIVTILIYIFIGLLFVKKYDSYKIDFLKIEHLKKVQLNKGATNYLLIFVRWLKGLIFCSHNTGIPVLYHRHGKYLYDGFSEDKNIIKIFILDILLIGIYWNTVIYTGISVLELLLGIK